MLYMFDGKNGNGKSLGLTREIGLRLEQTAKTVCTNMEELKLPELNHFLHERAAKRGEDPPDLDRRLIVIPKDKTQQYFRYRSGGLILPEVIELDEREKRIPMEEFRSQMVDYFKPIGQSEETRRGVIYFLDEAQDYFGSRETMENGRSMFWHVSKHRHLDDDIFWATPAYEELDVRIRRKIHRWHRLVNCYNLKLKGFRAPGGFKQYVFYSEPRPGQEHSEVISYALGEGWENCYETTNALGVRGKPETRPPGWAPPFWMLITGLAAAVALGAFVLWSLPKIVGHGIGHVMGGLNSSMLHEIAKNNPVPNSTPAPNSSPSQQIVPVPSPISRSDSTNQRRYYSGVMTSGTGVEVFSLDDHSWVEVMQVVPGHVKAVVVADGSILYPEPSIHAQERLKAADALSGNANSVTKSPGGT